MMRSAFYSTVGTFLALTIPTANADAQDLPIDSVAARIHAAYAAADADALGRWFADSVAFDGDAKVIADVQGGSESGERTVVMHDPTARLRPDEVVNPNWIAATLSANSLTNSYRKLVAQIGREQMAELLATLPWRVIRSDRNGYPYRQVREGDHVIILHLDGDRPDDNLGLAVMFVLREVDDEVRIVAHLADY